MIKSNTTNIIATDNLDTAGAISYWRLAGDTDLADLVTAWTAAGLDAKLLPAAPSGKVALARALADCEGRIDENTRRQAVKAKSGWWGLLEFVADDKGNITTHQIAKACWDSEAPVLVIEDTSPFLEQRIRDAAVVRGRVLAATDISGWLIKLADKHAALGLRDAGGIYFVPRTHLAFWNQVAQVVESVADGHKVFRIPALKTDEAVAAIVDAITVEANKAAETLTAALMAEGDAAPGERALRSMAVECETKRGKVQYYENLLGVKLPEVMARVQDLASKVDTVTKARAAGVTSAAAALAGPVAYAALTKTAAAGG